MTKITGFIRQEAREGHKRARQHLLKAIGEYEQSLKRIQRMANDQSADDADKAVANTHVNLLRGVVSNLQTNEEWWPKAEWRMTTIKVRGSGDFPYDMLRYDNCVPMSSEDAVKIGPHGPPGLYTVQLQRFSSDAGKATADRWKSFGWEVYEDTGVEG